MQHRRATDATAGQMNDSASSSPGPSGERLEQGIRGLRGYLATALVCLLVLIGSDARAVRMEGGGSVTLDGLFGLSVGERVGFAVEYSLDAPDTDPEPNSSAYVGEVFQLFSRSGAILLTCDVVVIGIGNDSTLFGFRSDYMILAASFCDGPEPFGLILLQDLFVGVN